MPALRTQCNGENRLRTAPGLAAKVRGVTLLRLFLLLPLLAAAPCLAAAETASRYETRAEHDPQGSGKFYMGREIAPVMGHQAAGWLERPEREEEEKTELLVESLEFKPGEIVADIGAGTGYLSSKIARKILPEGKVLAVDIQQEMLNLLKRKMGLLRIANVEPVLGEEKDPRLPAGGVDTIIMVDVYHELAFPYEMTENMVRGLKPGGRLVFVEFRAEDPAVPIKAVHKMSKEQLKKEMAAIPGLRFEKTIDVLPWQHIAIFRKQTDR